MVAIGFIFISLTMNKSITLVLVLDANPQVAPLPVSGRPIISILNFLKIAAAVFASIVFICDMSAEARCGTCASARQCMGAGLVFPERLVGAELRIDCLPSGSCFLELAARGDGIRSAPVNHYDTLAIPIGS